MTIVSENYYSFIQNVDYTKLTEVLKQGWDFVARACPEGDWTNYNASEKIRETIDTYFLSLSEYLQKNTKALKYSFKEDVPKQGTAKPTKRKTTQPSKPNAPAKEPKTKKPKEKYPDAALVERIPDEIKFIRRFLAFHDKSVESVKVLRLINALQKAIVERRIGKTSPYADEIRYIQDKLVSAYNSMGASATLSINDEKREVLKAIIHKEVLYPSVILMKRYLSLNGKQNIREKVEKLIRQADVFVSNDMLTEKDKYAKVIVKMYKNLNDYLTNKGQQPILIERAELNGLEGLIKETAGDGLNGVDIWDMGKIPAFRPKLPTVMNSMEFAKLKFSNLGFKGKWKAFIGDPSAGFSAMVFGKPKFGKSFLCIEFAGYLAGNHGKVLYVAKEEGLDKTLQIKLHSKEVKHPNLDVASELPDNLSRYDFVFLDSVNKLGISPEGLEKLEKTYPGKSFIYIFQTRKDGNFRGANTFQHDVDIVIEVPEKGKAIQYGRFGSGEMEIF